MRLHLDDRPNNSSQSQWPFKHHHHPSRTSNSSPNPPSTRRRPRNLRPEPTLPLPRTRIHLRLQRRINPLPSQLLHLSSRRRNYSQSICRPRLGMWRSWCWWWRAFCPISYPRRRELSRSGCVLVGPVGGRRAWNCEKLIGPRWSLVCVWMRCRCRWS